MISIKKILEFEALVLFCFWASISTSYAATISTASPSYSDVNAAVSAAGPGDTVIVPAGLSNWGTNQLVIRKGIYLRGAGIGQTIITVTPSSGSAISYSPDTTSVSNNIPFEFSGFTMDGADTNSTASSIYLFGVANTSKTTAISKVKICKNRFQNFKGTGLAINGVVWGVAYDNQFNDVLMPYRNTGDDRNAWDYWWDSFGYGNGNAFFFEDNTITWTHGGGGGLYGFMSIGQGGRGVVRYNTWDMANVGGGIDLIDLWDVHGNQAADNWSGIGSEWYGNSIINDTRIRNRRLISLRGGRNLVFYNNWAFTPGANFVLHLWDSHADSLTPINGCESLEICQECIRPQHINDTYVWINLANGTNKTISKTSDACNVVDENKDYFNYTPAFNGRVGIGCGVLASRPATCTVGVGYWATDQSCSDVARYVGANPTAPISGTLYKCTAPNAWTAYFTPYTYPHPLRGPMPPGQLRVIQ